MAAEEQGERPGLPAVAAAAAALVSGVGLLTLTGALGRVQRNRGEAFAWAVACVLVGATVWVSGALISEKARKRRVLGRNIGLREAVQALGLLLSLIGLIIGFRAAIQTANDTEQPAVALKLSDDRDSVSGTAKVGNLSSEDRLTVYVDGLVGGEGRPYHPSNLYQAFVGPDGDGDAVHDVRVTLPPGRFDAVGIRAFTARDPQNCGTYPLKSEDDGEEGTGCVIIRLPARPTHPKVTASWEGTERSATSLKVTLEAADVAAVPKDNLVLLRVVGAGKGALVSLYRTVVVLPPGGADKREVRLPVEAGLRTVCVEGLLVPRGVTPPDPSCPIRERAEGAAVELRLPNP